MCLGLFLCLHGDCNVAKTKGFILIEHLTFTGKDKIRFQIHHNTLLPL